MAVAVFWAIASLTFTVGRWFVPGFAVGAVTDRLGPGVADSAEARLARLFDLQTATGGPNPASGAMDAFGALDGRFIFEHLDGLELYLTDAAGNPANPGCETRSDLAEGECRHDVKVRLRESGGAILLISGRRLALDTEAAEGFSITLSAPGLTFNSKPGQCTMALTEADVFGVRVAGWVECRGLTELRSAATVDLLAIFNALDPPGY